MPAEIRELLILDYLFARINNSFMYLDFYILVAVELYLGMI